MLAERQRLTPVGQPASHPTFEILQDILYTLGQTC